ncbi:unnamed protein product [Miscanthus lutarioriparius]|uniref:Cyclin n=1 Tax=Miscanthus lutarioriparius TaxID=422564 RepID=A0A811QXE3_9POAL|nr:unnamed protein product [Miscanthus lutarioriparius]
MATSELPSESDAFAFPCRDDDGTSTALSPPVVISVLASILERHIARNERALAAAAAPGDDADGSESAAAATRKKGAGVRQRHGAGHESARVPGALLPVRARPAAGGAGVRVVRANAQRLLTTAILVASKFVEDRNYSNSHFAAVGGLAPAELGALELGFLFLLQFRLNICTSLFRSYCRHLEREVSHGGWYYRVQRPPLDRALVVYAGEARAQHRQAEAA